jgi:hypothetical protein
MGGIRDRADTPDKFVVATLQIAAPVLDHCAVIRALKKSSPPWWSDRKIPAFFLQRRAKFSEENE